MFEAYRVAVRISLIDGVSTGLAGITAKFAKAEVAGAAFHKRLDKINSSLLKSGAVAMAGFAGLGMLKHALKPATEYANQLSLINQLGLTQVETANLVSAAWKTSHDVMTSSVAGNLKTLRELRSAFGAGHEDYAIQSLSPTQMMSGMLTALTGKEQERIGFDVVKSIELRTPLMTAAAVNSNIAQMSQTVVGMGGTIDPHDYHLALKGAKSAALGWSDEFVYKYLPTIMQSTKAGHGGAGTAGVALMSLSQSIHGMVQKAAIPYLEQGGLLNRKDVVRNATGQWQLKAGAMAGTAMFDNNPYQWAKQFLTPAVNKIMNEEHVSAVTAINQLFRNRNASFVALTMYSKQQQFDRDAQLIGQANGINGYNSLLKTNPQLASMALSKQWSNLLAIIGFQVMPKLIEGALWLIPKIQSLTDYFKKNAGMAQGLVYGLGGLATAMAIGGTISAAMWAFKGLGLVLAFSGIGGATGIAALGVSLGPVAIGLAAIGAAIVGWKVGGVINSHLPASVGNAIGSYIAHGAAMLGDKDAQAAIDANDPHIRSGMIRHGRPIHNTIVMPNGKVLAEVVTHEQAKSAARPQAGSSGFDGRMSLHPVAAH
ncbi:MAG: hypothetical protein V4446_13620 [Pseudomonadota bacterium]